MYLSKTICTTELIYNYNNYLLFKSYLFFRNLNFIYIYIYFAVRFCEHKSISRLLMTLTYLSECVYCIIVLKRLESVQHTKIYTYRHLHSMRFAVAQNLRRDL